MATIDKLDIGIYIQYARRTQMIEQINQQYQLDKASTIAPQIQVVDLFPKLSEMELLLGTVTTHAPWAYFYPPKSFNNQRRSPFAFFRVIPSLGSKEKQQEDYSKLEAILCTTPEEVQEKEVINGCFQKIEYINGLINFIIGRIGQFLQG